MSHREKTPKRPRMRISKAARGKFGVLLIALIGLMLSGPLLEKGRFWGFTLSVFSGAVLVAGLYAASPSRRSFRIGIALAVADVVISRLTFIDETRWLVVLVAISWLCTLTYVTVSILEAIFSKQSVDIESLQASLCIYLLFGLIWVYFYALVELLVPGSLVPDDGPALLVNWTNGASRRTEFVRLFVFSYSTLSMTGFGGMKPGSPFVRMCICLEVMSAQVYLAVVIARLVGMQAIEVEETHQAS